MKTICALSSFALVFVLLLSGCDSRPKWQDGQTAEEGGKGPVERIVLFAAADPGPLAAEDPELATRFPRDMTKYIHSLVDFAQARYSENIPASGDAAWQAGPVSTVSGAHLAVLTTVEAVTEERIVVPPYSQMVATVTMRAYDVLGNEFWRKTATGAYRNQPSPKLGSPGAQPSSRAAWEATRKCVLSLSRYLQDLEDITRDDKTQQPDLDSLALIDVLFDSIPANADVVIDGTVRGTTPCVIAVPDIEIEVQLRRQGYQTWSGTVKPEVGQQLKPALEPLVQ
jgi:hypothetical protein